MAVPVVAALLIMTLHAAAGVFPGAAQAAEAAGWAGTTTSAVLSDYADEIGDRLRAAQSATALVADPSVQGARVAAYDAAQTTTGQQYVQAAAGAAVGILAAPALGSVTAAAGLGVAAAAVVPYAIEGPGDSDLQYLAAAERATVAAQGALDEHGIGASGQLGLPGGEAVALGGAAMTIEDVRQMLGVAMRGGVGLLGTTVAAMRDAAHTAADVPVAARSPLTDWVNYRATDAERFGFLVLNYTLGTATAVKFATATEIARQNPGMSTLEVLRATNAAISDTPRAIGAPPSTGARVGAMAYDTLELMSHMLLEGLTAFDQGSAGMPQLG
jgi:hypothetical protein